MAKVFITGATGYIGSKVVLDLLENTDSELLLFARSDKRINVSDAYKNRIQYVSGDLSEAEPYRNVSWADISHVIHCAANVAFNVKENDANQVNRDGTVRLLQQLRNCPKLEKFTYVSTVYASGLQEGVIDENFFTGEKGFSNHYERSKWESEESIRTQFSALPWQIARVATVLCDDESGKVGQYNAVHNTLKLMYYGLISLIPGERETPVYLVTGDEVAAAIADLNKNAPIGKIFNISHDDKVSLKLGQLVDMAYDNFLKDEAFKTKRILKPLFTDKKSFDTLVNSVQAFGGQVLNQAVSSIAPFGQQLFITKKISNENLKKCHPRFQDFDAAVVLNRTCEYLAKSKFGRNA